MSLHVHMHIYLCVCACVIHGVCLFISSTAPPHLFPPSPALSAELREMMLNAENMAHAESSI